MTRNTYVLDVAEGPVGLHDECAISRRHLEVVGARLRATGS